MMMINIVNVTLGVNCSMWYGMSVVMVLHVVLLPRILVKDL